jgi:MFS transporter, SHS family, lactate transporter
VPLSSVDSRNTISSLTDRANSRNAFLAGFLAWTFDAFDFFILTYVLAQVALDFHRPVRDIAFTLTASLIMRPVGAIIFGLMADRYGRRIPLMLNILFFSVVEVASGLAPSFQVFLILRLLYGIGMGGTWGLGASLAMESAPPKMRGFLSGILQEGYALGNLLAAVAFWTVFPRWGWRPMFLIGIIPALITLVILLNVKESEAWKTGAATQRDWGSYFRALLTNWKRFAYLVLFMTMMTFLSHGTQDLYPTFLQLQRHYDPRITAIISAISMLGAIIGGTLMGFYSDLVGRRRAMITSVLGAFLIIPLWVFSPGIALTAAGAFLMQFMVQGAWGVIPAHISELSPDRVRGFMPGFAYQLGVLITATAPFIQATLAHRFTYAQVMGTFAAAVMILAIVVIRFGPEAHRITFGQDGKYENGTSI